MSDESKQEIFVVYLRDGKLTTYYFGSETSINIPPEWELNLLGTYPLAKDYAKFAAMAAGLVINYDTSSDESED